MAKKTYNVVTPVQHDQVPYNPGEPVDLEDKDAKPLLEVGAIEAAAEMAKSGGKK